jgi:cyclophilin family peptidyl-prolyl cis-trans isomerase
MFPIFYTRALTLGALTTSLFILTACGSSSSTAPSTVSAVTANSPVLGKLTTFTIAGSNLSDPIAPTTTGCSGLTVLSSTSSTSRQFTCTPDAPAVSVTVNYGAQTPFVANIDIPFVTSVTSANASYGKTSNFLVNGGNLPADLKLTATGCSTLVNAPSTSKTLREFTCTPEGSSVSVSVDLGASSPFTRSVALPLPQVTLVTSMGTVVVELYPDKAPVSVKNFLAYVNNGFYSNTIFHRVVAGFVSQGGGFVSDPVNKIAPKANTTPAIVLESNNGLSNAKYTLAMARTSVPNSATSQFYFNAANNTALDYKSTNLGEEGYAVFGKAISGTAVLDSMNAVANAKLTSGTYLNMPNVPTIDLVLQSATRNQ